MARSIPDHYAFRVEFDFAVARRIRRTSSGEFRGIAHRYLCDSNDAIASELSFLSLVAVYSPQTRGLPPTYRHPAAPRLRTALSLLPFPLHAAALFSSVRQHPALTLP